MPTLLAYPTMLPAGEDILIGSGELLSEVYNYTLFTVSVRDSQPRITSTFQQI